MGFDDAEAHRQSDARADARGLRREIGLEHPRAKMLRYAGTVVGDLDAHHVGRGVEAAGHPYPARRGTILQRLLRVDDQVEHHLVELVGVGQDQRNVRARDPASTSMLLVRMA